MSVTNNGKQKSVLAASMFEQAELHFEGEKIVCVELLDSIVSEGKKEYIVTLLEEVLSRRFGMQAEIRVLYREQEENQSREYDEQRIQQEINAIFERRARQKGEILQKPISERQTDSAKEKKTSEQNITMLPLSRYSTIPAQLTFPESTGSLSAP